MSVNNVNSLNAESLNTLKNKAAEITSSSSESIWNEYKQFDVNGDGKISDDFDNMSDSDIERIGKQLGIISDGKIQDTKQSKKTGDCYLLSGVNALSSTSKGQEAISNAIKHDDNGGYNVSFYNAQGELETLNVTAEELAANPGKYSDGDVDMKIIEIAAEKFYAAHLDEEAYSYKDPKDILTRGLMEGKSSIVYMLTGSEGHVMQMTEVDKTIPKSALSSNRDVLNDENLTEQLLTIADNPDDYASMCIFKKKNFMQKVFKKFDNVADHGYSIKGVQKNAEGAVESVILLNPWDTSKEIVMPLDEFKSKVSYFVSHSQNEIM